MRDRIRRLPWKVEFAIVLGVAFSWTLPSTLGALMTPAIVAHRPTPPISDISVWATILLELIILGLLTPFLLARGWTLARLGLQPSLWGCLQGVGLAVAGYGLYFGFAMFVSSIWPDVARALAETRIVADGLSWSTIIIASTVNPCYEEIFVCGYVISVLTQRRAEADVAPAEVSTEGEANSVEIESVDATSSTSIRDISLATAINISAGIRLSYHLYQGVAGVLGLVPIGLLFGVWFARTRQLWPLIVAHAILDFLGLAAGAG
jgi:membrane protease YdiL (CAAX protease family)